MAFNQGDNVEICSKEEGFEGSYYEAKLVMQLFRNEYIVEYRTLLKDDMSEPLKEVVSAAEIRPPPPDFPMDGGFKVDDKVDAFDNDGWWAGKVTGKTGDLYSVYFEPSNVELSYPVDRLRVHQDWVDGKWLCSNRPVLD